MRFELLIIGLFLEFGDWDLGFSLFALARWFLAEDFVHIGNQIGAFLDGLIPHKMQLRDPSHLEVFSQLGTEETSRAVQRSQYIVLLFFIANATNENPGIPQIRRGLHRIDRDIAAQAGVFGFSSQKPADLGPDQLINFLYSVSLWHFSS